MNKKIKIKLIRSIYGRHKGHFECLKGLGLNRINKIVEVDNTPSNLGMLNKVFYLITIIND